MGRRAGRWLTQQVGEYRRAVSVVAAAFLKTTADQRFGPASPSHGAAGRTLGSTAAPFDGRKGHKPQVHAVAITSGPPRGLTAPPRPHVMAVSGRCSGGSGVCEPLATLGL